MYTWTKSACVVLTWSILLIMAVAAGMTGPARPAQANTRTASSAAEVTLTSTLSAAAALGTAARPAARYVVQPGGTLSGIAARFAVRGGWPALYAANRPLIGPDPNVIRPGAVLTVPRPAAPSPAAPRPAGRPVSPLSAPAGTGHRPLPGRTGAPAAAGMPQWLKILLLAVGLVILAAFLTGPVLAVRRRRRVHPAGLAVPSAVLAAGIVLFTFVESATVRVVPPPGGSGLGSVYMARPSTGQPHHRLPPRQPGQPALPGSPGHNARSLNCNPGQIALPLPVPAAVPPAGPGRAPQASRNPSSRLPGGGLVCDVKRVPPSAAATAAGSGGADR